MYALFSVNSFFTWNHGSLNFFVDIYKVCSQGAILHNIPRGILDVGVLGNTLTSEGNIERVNLQYTASTVLCSV